MAIASRPGPLELGLNLLRGLLMGAADVVPGVSGGTVALVVGIYDRLVRSIRAAAAAPVMLGRGDLTAARTRFREVDWALVLPLAVGIGVAIVAGAAVIPDLMERHPEPLRGVFFGLITGSLALPWRRIGTRTARVYALAAAAAVVAFLLVGLPQREVVDPALPVVFASAMVAICAMILPGVSGAFLLLVLGVYTPTLEAVSDRDLVFIGVFAAGAALGLGLFAKLLETLLERWHDLTMAALVGLMVGALRALWPWLDDDRALHAPPADASVLVVVAAGGAAFALVTGVVLLARRGERTHLDAR